MDAPERLTLGVLFYNQETFAEQAVQGALAQSYSPLEIVLSDDASSDETFEVIQRAVEGYEGPHQVVLNRNTANLGLVGNVNRVMELATGEIVLLAGGDDIAMPHRAARAAEVLAAENGSMCASFGASRFEGSEMPVERQLPTKRALTRYTMGDYVSAPFFHLEGSGRAYRRRVFDLFGPIAADCPIEDYPLLLRCFLLGDVLTTPEAQVHYRVHEGGISQHGNKHQFDLHAIYRQYLQDLTVAVEHGLLTEDERERLRATLERRRDQKMLWRNLHFAPNRVAVFRIIVGSSAVGRARKWRMLLGALTPWSRY